MERPRRIRLSRARGWRLPAGAVNVARPGKWGNPFVVGKDGTRLQCVAMFAALAGGFIALGGRQTLEEQIGLYRRLRRSIGELEGRDLACWCAEDGHCHGDFLLWLANAGRPHPLAGIEIEMPRVRLGMDAREFERLLRAKARADQGASQ